MKIYCPDINIATTYHETKKEETNNGVDTPTSRKHILRRQQGFNRRNLKNHENSWFRMFHSLRVTDFANFFRAKTTAWQFGKVLPLSTLKKECIALKRKKNAHARPYNKKSTPDFHWHSTTSTAISHVIHTILKIS